MLSEFFESPSRIRAIRSGPSGALLESFANHLFKSGYGRISARKHLRSAEHIIHWAVRRCLSLRDVNGTALDHFGIHLTRCRCGRYSRTDRAVILTGARLFLNHLLGDGYAIRVTRTTAPEPALLRAFCAWMREGSIPEPIHKEIYATLGIPAQVMKPVKTWHELPDIVTE